MSGHVVAVIPARGKSTRLPRKNVRQFLGRPMIAWPIKAAQESGLFHRIIVSTEDAEIAEVAREHGAEVPFTRPGPLASEAATHRDVVRHAIDWLSAADSPAATVCCIFATAPFLRAADLRHGLELLRSGPWRSVFAATSFGHPVVRGFEVTTDGRIRMLFPAHHATRSQDVPSTFHDAGMFYWADATTWLGGEPFFVEASTVVRIPRWRAQDIDTEEDWRTAELLAAGAAAVQRTMGQRS